MHCAWSLNYEGVVCLLRNHTDANAVTSADAYVPGASALHCVARVCQYKTLEEVLDGSVPGVVHALCRLGGADVFAEDEAGETPLACARALEYGHEDAHKHVVKHLFAAERGWFYGAHKVVKERGADGRWRVVDEFDTHVMTSASLYPFNYDYIASRVLTGRRVVRREDGSEERLADLPDDMIWEICRFLPRHWVPL